MFSILRILDPSPQGLISSILIYLISIIAKASLFEDVRVEEQEELFEPEGKCFFQIRYISPNLSVNIKY